MATANELDQKPAAPAADTAFALKERDGVYYTEETDTKAGVPHTDKNFRNPDWAR